MLEREVTGAGMDVNSLFTAGVRPETQQTSLLPELTAVLHSDDSQDQLAPCLVFMVNNYTMSEPGGGEGVLFPSQW